MDGQERKSLQSIREEVMNTMKYFRHTPNIRGFNYADLGHHPYLALPEGFKVPKFDTFSVFENPLTHLRAYSDQLIGVWKDETLLM